MAKKISAAIGILRTGSPHCRIVIDSGTLRLRYWPWCVVVQHAVQQIQDAPDVYRFREKRHGAGRLEEPGCPGRCIRCHDDHWNRPAPWILPQPSKDLLAGEIRQMEIEEDHVRPVRARECQAGFAT